MWGHPDAACRCEPCPRKRKHGLVPEVQRLRRATLGTNLGGLVGWVAYLTGMGFETTSPAAKTKNRTTNDEGKTPKASNHRANRPANADGYDAQAAALVPNNVNNNNNNQPAFGRVRANAGAERDRNPLGLHRANPQVDAGFDAQEAALDPNKQPTFAEQEEEKLPYDPRRGKTKLPRIPQQGPQMPVPVEEKEPARPNKTSPWWMPGDNLDTVRYCEKKLATPDKVDGLMDEATQQVSKIEPEALERLQKTMSKEDMTLVAFYTTQASYALNAVLRGQLVSDPWVGAYGELARKTGEAVKRAPQGIANCLKTVNGETLHDQKQKADKVVALGDLYRIDSWSGFFDPVFASDYQVGRQLEEPGFLSTTVNKGAYNGEGQVKKTIEGGKVARSISDMSTVGTENEVLFPPGERFAITSIELEDEKAGTRQAVPRPTAVLPDMDKGARAFNGPDKIWHVRLKHVGVAKEKK